MKTLKLELEGKFLLVAVMKYNSTQCLESPVRNCGPYITY